MFSTGPYLLNYTCSHKAWSKDDYVRNIIQLCHTEQCSENVAHQGERRLKNSQSNLYLNTRFVLISSALRLSPSSPVAIALEMKPQLEDAVGKLAAEAVSMRVLPFAVDDLKSNVLIGRPGVKTQDAKVLVIGAWLKEVLRGGALVDQVWVKDIELVTLDDFGRRVVKVVVRLVVLVPLEACVYTVEEARLAWPVLVSPHVHFPSQGHLDAELGLITPHALFCTSHKRVLCTLAGVA